MKTESSSSSTTTTKPSSSSSSSSAAATSAASTTSTTSTSSSSFSSCWKNHINEFVHQEPYESLCYGIFWFLILVIATPVLAVIALFPLTLYRLIAYKKDWNNAKKYDPEDVDNSSSKQLAILVTGCDSGFGKDIALQASEAGYVVFAGCLNKESLEYYKDKENIKPILMDVTSDKDVQDALLQVQDWINNKEDEGEDDKKRRRKRLFHALINNAGISIPGRLDFNGSMAVNMAQKVMDVNYFGTIRTCQHFLEIFKDQRMNFDYVGGRIINITSIAGIIPGRQPSMWNYAASKHATQTFSEGLRKELSVWDISVTTINPGFHSTSMLTNSSKQVLDQWNNICTSDIKEQYGEAYLNSIIKKIDSFIRSGFPPKQVTSTIMDVLYISKPPGQVLVGMDARYLFILTKLIPSWLSDMELLTSQSTVPAILKNKMMMNNKTDIITTSSETTTNTSTTEKVKSQ